MTFISLIFKNIWRQKTRTLLTTLGISIGIATIVVFGLATSGLKDTVGSLLRPGKADFTVAKAGSADIIVSFIGDDQIEKIKGVKGVKDVLPYVMTMAPLGANPYFIIAGMDQNKLELSGVKVTKGKPFSNDREVIIGKITEKNQRLEIGDKLVINKAKYKITGVFESGISFQDSGAITTIKESQRLQGITDKVNMVGVVVKDGFNVKEVAERVELADKELVSIVDMEDFESVDQGTKMIDAISIGISFLAVIIGAIGVMNTIIMSVFERTREIGVLRAVGWKRRRVVRMILGESMLIGFFAAVIGAVFGTIIIVLLMNTELGESWLKVNYEPVIYARAMAVSLGVVFLGSLYPAYKASRLLPTEALRYE